ncbi:MAG TPA: sulfatase [Pirellulales bacterium]|jgi:choline-sulfatase
MLKRSWIIRLLMVAVAGSFFLQPTDAPAAKPNVLFLIADDLNCDLHCYGHPRVQSPNIDRLAGRGVRFEHAYCQFPLCSPSRTSFLTGRRPNATKVLSNPRAARFSVDYKPTPHFREFIPDTVTLPQLFRQQGYQVARIGKLFHYGVPGEIGTSGLDDRESWDYFVNPAGRDKAEENLIFTLKPHSYGATLSWRASEGADQEQTDGLSATAAISQLEEYKATPEKPFFLAVGFYRPHTPYVAPKKYFELYPQESIVLPTLSAADKARRPPGAYATKRQEEDALSDERRRQAIQAYWAAISFMDAQVGRVIEALDKLGLADNTIIVMTSDHGYHMYQHGLWQKMTLFENSARVPLIIAAPRAAGNGKSTASLAELVDFYPTLADLCGVSAPAYLDGVSQKPVLDDPTKAVKDTAFTQLTRGENPAYSIRTPEWRFTQWNGGKGGEQLFDMQNDPGETTNLVNNEKHAATLEALRAKVRKYADGGK